MSYDIHQTPGRIRIRMPHLKKQNDAAMRAKSLVAALDGVTSVHASTVTGSLVVRFDTQRILAARIINALGNAGFLHGIIGFPKPMPPLLSSSSTALAPLRNSTVLPPLSSRIVNHVAKIILVSVVERTMGKTACKVVNLIL